MHFHLLRVSINANQNVELFAHAPTPTEKFTILRNAIEARATGVYRNVAYQFTNLEFDAVSNAVVGRISRPDDVEVSQRDPQTGDLRDGVVDSNAWAHFVFWGINEQVLAVQRKQDFFSGSPEGLAAIAQAMLSQGMDDERFQVAVFPVSREGDFWDVIRRSNKVKSVEFEFVAPNMFEGRRELATLLAAQRALHNAITFKAAITNDDGGLRVNRENLGNEVNYVAGGGGAWAVRHEDQDGVTKLTKSTDDSVLARVDVEREDRGSILPYLAVLIQRIRAYL